MEVKADTVEIFNYNIKQFLTEQLPVDYEVYTNVLKNITAQPVLNDWTMDKLEQQPFKNIITIENLFKGITNRPQNKIDIVSVCFGIPTEDIEVVGIHEFYKAFNFIHTSYNVLIERENTVLFYEPDMDEVSAGVERMAKFGRIATVDALSGHDILKHAQIIDLTYQRVFTKLQLDKTRADIQRDLQKIKQSNNDSTND